MVAVLLLVSSFAALPMAAIAADGAPVVDPAASANASPSPSATAAASPSDPCTTTLAVVTRPSVTTSPCAVKPNHVVIETGYQSLTADGGAPTAQYPQTFIRAGTATGNLEVSVAPPTIDRSGGATGSGDTSFGAKYEIGYSAKWLYAVNALVTLPTGLAGYSAGGTGYTANADLAYVLTPGIGLATTLGYNSLSDGTRRYTSIIASLVASAAVASTTTLFGEVATFSHALGPLSATRVQLLAGLQQSVANKVQFDLEAGRSATAATGKYRYVGAGVSYSF